MRSIWNHLPHHIADLCQLVHQVDSVMKPSCCVDYHDIRILCHSRLDRIKSHGGRIRTHLLLHKVNTGTLRPYRKLIHRCSTECISRTENHLLALSLQAACQLAYGRGLAYTVHSHHHDDIRLLREVKRNNCILRGLPLLHIQKGRDLITQHIHKFIKRDILILAYPFLQTLDYLKRRIYSHISRKKRLLNGIQHVLIHLCPSDNRP